MRMIKKSLLATNSERSTNEGVGLANCAIIESRHRCHHCYVRASVRNWMEFGSVSHCRRLDKLTFGSPQLHVTSDGSLR